MAAICFLPVEVGVDLAATDTERCVEEGDGYLGRAGATVRVRVALLLAVLNGKLGKRSSEAVGVIRSSSFII